PCVSRGQGSGLRVARARAPAARRGSGRYAEGSAPREPQNGPALECILANDRPGRRPIEMSALEIRPTHELFRRTEAAERLQKRGRLCGGGVAADPNRHPSISVCPDFQQLLSGTELIGPKK